MIIFYNFLCLLIMSDLEQKNIIVIFHVVHFGKLFVIYKNIIY